MRSLLIAAVVLGLSGCSIFEDKPQYVFRVLALPPEEMPAGFLVQTHSSGLILVAPFIAACADARITADVRESDRDLRLTVHAAGCEGQNEPSLFGYEITWNGLDDGTYTLTVRHEGELDTPDGVVHEETVVIS